MGPGWTQGRDNGGMTDAAAPAPKIDSQDAPDSAAEGKAAAAKDPLHGVTLAHMVEALADWYGWQELGERIPIRCFQSEPSVNSSLKFLRKTPWAREKVEGLYLYTLREDRRQRGLSATSGRPRNEG